jgi:hypothetical protein
MPTKRRHVWVDASGGHRYPGLVIAWRRSDDGWEDSVAVARDGSMAMQLGDRGFRDILTQAFPAAPELRVQRDRVYHGVAQLIERKPRPPGGCEQTSCPKTSSLVLMANAGVVAATAEHAQESSDRLVGYLLQAFTATAAGELPPPATPRRMYRALTRHQPD